MHNHRPVIGITMGDPCGVGAEIIVKALTDVDLRARARFIIFGFSEQLAYTADRMEQSFPVFRDHHEEIRRYPHDLVVLDYDEIREQARKVRPKLIICGTSAYSRTIDFKRFREIADEVGAYLLSDVSHIAGLIIASAHPSPVDYAHFTTTSTYKLGGPRGGLILMGKDYNQKIRIGIKSVSLWGHIEKTTFPGVQGTPYLNNIAAKAVFFKETLSEEYKARQFRIIENAKALAESLLNLGHDVLTGGTDNHMILINVDSLREGLTGHIAQKCLEQCGIIVNMNKLPYDRKGPTVTSGVRLGTPIVTKNGMGPGEMKTTAALFDSVLRNIKTVGGGKYEIDQTFKNGILKDVKQLCRRFPMW